MSKVIHIQSSPRGDQSVSIQVATAFLAAYREAHPDDWVDTLDLNAAGLPTFDAPAAEAKYAVLGGGVPQGPAEKKWREVIETVDAFMEAGKVVISAPMWNFGIPYRLKQYIDVIVQPGLTFKYVDGKSIGLATGRPAMLILARGGRYPPNSPAAGFDLQRPYLEMVLRFIGFENIQSIVVEPTLGEGPEVAARQLAAAQANARTLARSF